MRLISPRCEGLTRFAKVEFRLQGVDSIDASFSRYAYLYMILPMWPLMPNRAVKQFRRTPAKTDTSAVFESPVDVPASAEVTVSLAFFSLFDGHRPALVCVSIPVLRFGPSWAFE